MENENNLYDSLNCYIGHLNISLELKEILEKFNRDVYNILKTGDAFNYNILVENLSFKKINILKNYMIGILKIYNAIDGDILFYNEDFKKINRISRNSLVIVKESTLIKNKRFPDELNDFFEDIKKENGILMVFSENKLNDLLERYESIQQNFCIMVSGFEQKKDDIIREVKDYYYQKNIPVHLDDQFFDKMVDIYLGKYENTASCASDLYEWSYKRKVLLDCPEINEKCFDFFNDEKLDETEKNKETIEEEEKKNYFDDLIGLDMIKDEIESLKNYLSFQKKVNIKQTYLNMFFLGNPGTGKTTVARMYADVLYELGYIKENKIKEIIPTDLMGAYVGHTKEHARAIFKEAENGILFIDEAYLINNDSYKGNNSPYMKEAIVEIIKYLENPEHVVIFAGYPSEMKKVYQANPGIKSRISKEIYFEDYGVDQLIQIIERKLSKYQLKIDNKAKEEMKKLIEKQKQKRNFGNARFCEQYAQKIIMNHANRKLKNETFVITISDVKLEEEKNCMKMGFVGV